MSLQPNAEPKLFEVMKADEPHFASLPKPKLLAWDTEDNAERLFGRSPLETQPRSWECTHVSWALSDMDWISEARNQEQSLSTPFPDREVNLRGEVESISNEVAAIGYVARLHEVPPTIWSWLQDPEVLKIAHNAKHDYKAIWLATGGKVKVWPYTDTRIVRHILDPWNSAPGEGGRACVERLKEQYREWCVNGVYYEAPVDRWQELERLRTGDKKSFPWPPPDAIMLSYSAWDAVATLELYRAIIGQVPERSKKLLEFEMLASRATAHMELNGIAMDVERLEKIRDDNRYIQEQCRSDIDKLVSGNDKPKGYSSKFAGSDKQIGEWVYDIHGVTCPKRTAKGNRSVDDDSLGRILRRKRGVPTYVSDVLRLVQEYRKAEKRAGVAENYLSHLRDGNYTGKVLPSGQEARIMSTNYNTSGARSGRYSASNPQVHNPERKGDIRKCFVSRFPKDPE